MILNDYVSLKLERIRKEKGIGIYALCNKAGLSYETYRSIRRNKNKDIYLRTLFILLRALDVTPEQFFADDFFTSEDIDVDFK